MTYVSYDGTTYIRGWRSGGGKYDSNKRNLRKLPVPEGKTVKKVVQGKSCRFMLTTDGKTYWHGQTKHYQTTSSMSENFTDEWRESPDHLWKNEDDKIIDITAGKNCWQIITEGGKVYNQGFVSYRYFYSDDRYNT